MTDNIAQHPPVQTVSHYLYQSRPRVVGDIRLRDAVAHIEADIRMEVRYLDSKDEESRERDANRWVQQFKEKARNRKSVEELRKLVENMAGPDTRRGVPEGLLDPTLKGRLQQLADSLETDPAVAASSVLGGITDPATDHAWRRALVIAAEGVHFTDDQDRELMPALIEFIDKFRDSNDRENRIAVCSAIRSYVGLVGTADVSSITRLLEPGYRAFPPLDTTLEAMKMIARKFAANPPRSPNQFPELSDQLEGIARAFLNPYVLPHGKNAAVAMNAVQAHVALAGPEIEVLIAYVNESCPTWFRQQLQRRLTGLQEEWKAKLDGRAADQEIAKVLQEAIDRLQTD